MLKTTMKKSIFALAGLLGVCGLSQKVYAQDYSYLTEKAPSFYNTPSLDADGNAELLWSSMTDSSVNETASIVYEVEIAKNTSFTDAKSYVAKESKLALNKSDFGTNGGKFYARVRLVVDYVDEAQTDVKSAWSESEEMVFVKINKTNFPGMYNVLKNGGKYNSEKGGKIPLISCNRHRNVIK